RNIRDLALQLYQYAIGDTVELQIQRDDKQAAVRVPITERQGDPQRFADLVTPENNLVAKLGILAVTIDEKIRQGLSLRFNEAVRGGAIPGAPWYLGDQRKPGDIIHPVNRRPVTSIETLRAELDRAETAKAIVLQVERDGSLMFVVLEND